MICRRMQESDIDPVCVIEQAIQAYPWTRGHFLDSLHAGHTGWVLCEEEDILGFVMTLTTPDAVELLNIGVALNRQRCGLGRQLMSHLIGETHRQGLDRIILEVRPSNKAAIALYERFGFVRMGVRAGYYRSSGCTEDAVVMVKE